MAIPQETRVVITALQPYFSDTYQLLNAADAVLTALAVNIKPDYSTHEGIVAAALGAPVAIEYMRQGKKINAIKEVRRVTLCGLKEAKEAVEDDRVMVFYPKNPFGSTNVSY